MDNQTHKTEMMNIGVRGNGNPAIGVSLYKFAFKYIDTTVTVVLDVEDKLQNCHPKITSTAMQNGKV